jgi:poly-gamma-glutamate capsule biosynthesis protein CapA/YwtB (metallophosphatase superfamily)
MENFCLFLCGDVMIGRGIDQILPHPSKPQLYEPFVKDARDYVLLAEMAHGKIHPPVSPDYIWGDALFFWKELSPDVKIINLETSITQYDDYWPEKAINYRMHPANIDVLKAASIDICTLANNHILDWGYAGLMETIATLNNAGIQISGVGKNLAQAKEPAIFKLGLDKRVLVFSVATASSGTPSEWAATPNRLGLYYLPFLNHEALISIKENINQYRQAGDLIIFSIHWGSNWGYEVPESFRLFAQRLIDDAHIDVVFGHSSHHPRAIEVYQGKPIFYGCGDFINDYEGISGYEFYRGDLTLMYFLKFDSSLEFVSMEIIPLQINKFKLRLANTRTVNGCYKN